MKPPFKTATEWVAMLADAQRQGRLDDELARLQRIPLLICDEVGYIPFDTQAANLMFMLVARRYAGAYEKAGDLGRAIALYETTLANSGASPEHRAPTDRNDSRKSRDSQESGQSSTRQAVRPVSPWAVASAGRR